MLLLRLLARGLRVGERLLEGRARCCFSTEPCLEHGLELGFTLCELLGRRDRLCRPILPLLFEGRRHIAQFERERIAGRNGLRQLGVVLRLAFVELRGSRRQLQCMLLFRVLARGLRVGERLLEGRAHCCFSTEPCLEHGLELGFALCELLGRRDCLCRPILPLPFECRLDIAQLQCMLLLRLFARGLRVGERLLEGRARCCFSTEPCLEHSLELGFALCELLGRRDRLCRPILPLLFEGRLDIAQLQRMLLLRLVARGLRVGERLLEAERVAASRLSRASNMALSSASRCASCCGRRDRLCRPILPLLFEGRRDIAQLQRMLLLRLVARGLRVGECLLEGCACCSFVSEPCLEHGLKLGFAPSELFGRGDGLCSPILPFLLEGHRQIAELSRERVAGCSGLRHFGVVQRLTLGEVHRGGRQLRRMPLLEVVARRFRRRQSQFERVPSLGDACEHRAKPRLRAA